MQSPYSGSKIAGDEYMRRHLEDYEAFKRLLPLRKEFEAFKSKLNSDNQSLVAGIQESGKNKRFAAQLEKEYSTKRLVAGLQEAGLDRRLAAQLDQQNQDRIANQLIAGTKAAIQLRELQAAKEKSGLDFIADTKRSSGQLMAAAIQRRYY